MALSTSAETADTEQFLQTPGRTYPVSRGDDGSRGGGGAPPIAPRNFW